MGFDLRGAVQGAAYSNWFAQQARYRHRKEKEDRLKDERMEEMQRQGMAIDRFRAETTRIGNEQDAEAERKRVTAREAKLQWDKDTYDEQVKRDKLESDRTYQSRERAYGDADEDRDRGYKLDKLEHDRKVQKDADLKEWRTARTTIAAKQKEIQAPTTESGLITSYDEFYWDAWKEIKDENPNWSRLNDEKLRALTEQALDQADLRIKNFTDLYNAKIDAGKTLTAEGMLMSPEQYVDIQSLRGSFRQRLTHEGSPENKRLVSQRREVYSGILEKIRTDSTFPARYNAGELTEKEVEAIRAGGEARDEGIPPDYYENYLKIKANRDVKKVPVTGRNFSGNIR